MKNNLSWQCRALLLAGLMMSLGAAKAQAASRISVDAPTPTAKFWNMDAEEGDFHPSLKLKDARTGLASWYGRGFHGRRTASGERFDQEDLTCASRDLPFGTLVEITNLDNGKVAIARVNDRGPFVRHRLLDLSYGLARSLEFLGRGTAQIAYRVVENPEVQAN